MDGEVFGAMPTGMESTVKVGVDGYLLTGVVFGSTLFRIGEKTNVSFKGEGITLFDRRSGQRICAGTLEMLG